MTFDQKVSKKNSFRGNYSRKYGNLTKKPVFTKKLFWVLVIGFLNLVSVDAKERSLLTLKSLIKEYVSLDFSDFLSTLLAIFHVINEKFHPACLLIYLVNKQAV